MLKILNIQVPCFYQEQAGFDLCLLKKGLKYYAETALKN